MFNYYDLVFGTEDESVYPKPMGTGYQRKKSGVARTVAEKKRYYGDWRTYQLSDHPPIPVEVKIDFGEEYLEGKSNPP